MKSFFKYLFFLTALGDVYMIIAWTYAFHSFEHHSDRKEMMRSLHLEIPIDYIHHTLLALSLIALIASVKVSVNKLLKGLIITVLVFYLVFGTWSIL